MFLVTGICSEINDLQMQSLPLVNKREDSFLIEKSIILLLAIHV